MSKKQQTTGKNRQNGKGAEKPQEPQQTGQQPRC